ncbi:MAG TPA: hypothetical protein VGD69_12490 [Herpetosiphonaceae bacterium]
MAAEDRHLANSAGNRVGVVLNQDTYHRLLDAEEKLEDIRAYLAAKAANDEAIPLDQALAEIESERSQLKAYRRTIVGKLSDAWTSEHDRIGLAVHNHAVWCDTLSRVHSRAGKFLPGIWINRYAPPPTLPRAITLIADLHADHIAAISSLLAADIPGTWAVEDSFAVLDIASMGFRSPFSTTWLWRSSEPVHFEPEPDYLHWRETVAERAHVRWSQIESAPELLAWEMAWRGQPNDDPYARVFFPALLEDDSIVILAAYRDEQIVAGVIANRTGPVVGLAEMFVPAHDTRWFKTGCVIAVQERFPGLPIVGYESSRNLGMFRAMGFEELGLRRIWMRTYED